MHQILRHDILILPLHSSSTSSTNENAHIDDDLPLLVVHVIFPNVEEEYVVEDHSVKQISSKFPEEGRGEGVGCWPYDVA
jgi:hypothetical protein